MMVRFTDSDDHGDGGGSTGLAPVIPLFGGSGAASDRTTPVHASSGGLPPWNSTWAHDPDEADDDRDDRYADEGNDACGAIEREIAEKNLLKKLRTRSLSVREARAVIAERDIDDETVDVVIASFERLGYLDDAALAEQLVHSGSDRKGQGRKAIAQTLARRGIQRDVADAALGALPDDDAERALDYARSKAAGMSSLDRDTALRRLVGQLSRRGYPGSVAMTAAREALDEAAAPRSGVRFR